MVGGGQKNKKKIENGNRVKRQNDMVLNGGRCRCRNGMEACTHETSTTRIRTTPAESEVERDLERAR